MDYRFVEISLFLPISLLVDRETGVAYLRTTYAQIPVMTATGELALSGLPKAGEYLDSVTLKNYTNHMRERFVRTKTKTKSLVPHYLLLDKETGVEYLLQGQQLSPLLTAEGLLKTGKVEN